MAAARSRMLPDLVIDVADVMARDGNNEPSPPRTKLDRAMAAYTDVTRWLLLAPAPDATQGRRAIRSMRLRFYLMDPYLHFIGRAVGDAVERGGGTERLEFTLETEASATSNSAARHAEGAVFARRFVSFFAACPVAFSSLTGLTLQNLSFRGSEHGVPNLLINACIKLERLSLSHCRFGFALEIDAPSSPLAALEIKRCDYTRVELIRVPNLRCLLCDVWYCHNPPVRFGCVPRLHTIKLSSRGFQRQNPFTLSEWLSSTRSISELHLDFLDGKIWIIPENPKRLSLVFKNLIDVHLCNVHVDRNLDWTLFILEAAPSLRNFYVELSRGIYGINSWNVIADKTNTSWYPSKFEHRNLSLLEVVGFRSTWKLIDAIHQARHRARRVFEKGSVASARLELHTTT